MSNDKTTSTYRSIGGSSIDVIIQFPDIGGSISPYIYLGSAITVSYSVYRAKTPVYRLGDTTPNGFSIGKKTVAGTIVKAVMEEDEINSFIGKLIEKNIINNGTEIINGATSFSKELSTIMKDDLLDFNIILIFSTEYSDSMKQETIYGANIINNGQVMSAMDLFTETTMSFVAKDVRQLHDVSAKLGTGSNLGRTKNPTKTVSQVLFSK